MKIVNVSLDVCKNMKRVNKNFRANRTMYLLSWCCGKRRFAHVKRNINNLPIGFFMDSVGPALDPVWFFESVNVSLEIYAFL